MQRVCLIKVKLKDVNNIVPPHGIMMLGSVLEQEGFDVHLMDVDPLFEDVVSKINRISPDLIGYSFTTSEYARAKMLNKKLRQVCDKHTIFSAGGIHVTALPEQTLRDFDLDFVVIGEGEETLRECCICLRNHRTLKDVPGIAYIHDNTVRFTRPRELIKDLDTLPFPAHHLLPDFRKQYLRFPGVIRGRYIKSTHLFTGRGCSNRCIFCFESKKLYPGIRRRSVENVISEIILLKEQYGIKGFFFCDSTFTCNKKWVFKFCDALINQDLNLEWGGSARIDTVSEDLLAALKKARCCNLSFGIESGSNKILKILHKQLTRDQIIRSIKLVKKYGITCDASFMLGNPDESREDLELTFSLAKEINLDFTVIYYTIPFVGTVLYDQACTSGLFNGNSSDLMYKDWHPRRTHYPPYLLTKYLTAEELYHYRRKMQNYFFIRNNVHIENIGFLLLIVKAGIKHPITLIKIFYKAITHRDATVLYEDFFALIG